MSPHYSRMSPVRTLDASPFHTRYAPADAAPDAWTLACIRYGSAARAGSDPREIRVALEPLGGAHTELWQSHLPVEHGVHDGFGYAHNGEVLFAHLHLAESELTDLQRTTLRSYVRIDALLRHFGYPCWLRMWNFLARITDGAGDAERYRRFAEGRYHALAFKPGFENQLPAATAVGSRDGGLNIFFIAAKLPGLQIENPRQLSAFRYPREYGPRSPSFSRATLKQWQGETHLYVSGTASIVGHESRHAGDSLAQLDEVHRNIDSLLEQARLRVPGAAFVPQQLKLYLRAGVALEPARLRARQLFGADAPLICLEGDICRQDLLLEVEGMYAAVHG